MYQSFVGLEIHIQLLTKSKVFCSCPAVFGDEPNTNVCPVCMGYPGVLPTLNAEAIHIAYTVAKALNCTLAPAAVFERKNYFYPDMPKNYQISQYAHPVGVDGWLDIEIKGEKRRVRIHDVHLEEDAGKMMHVGDVSILDYNRAGTPLLEVVTEPDLVTGEDAEALLQQFRRIVRYLGVCDGNMEEGSMRCDANVSINLKGHGLGRKVEIKNLNSSRFVKKALSYEIERQSEVLSRGGTIRQETRLWNENRDLTESMRTKEGAHDYRYFPEPDLPPFRPDAAFHQRVDAAQVELPLPRRDRFVAQYKVTADVADFLVDERFTADFFEEAVKRGADPSSAANWLASDVQKILNRNSQSLEQSPLTVERFASLLKLLATGKIHGKLAKQVLDAVFLEDADPETIIHEKGWDSIDDHASLASIIDSVLDKHPQALAQIAAGDQKPLGFLMGQVMRETQGRAEPQTLQKALRDRIAAR